LAQLPKNTPSTRDARIEWGSVEPDGSPGYLLAR
jgi:hypothetical protein